MRRATLLGLLALTVATLAAAPAASADTLPRCTTVGGDPGSVATRPGATRRFAVLCTDPDGDYFSWRVQQPTSGGTLTVRQPAPAQLFAGERDANLDVIYVPNSWSAAPDSFTLLTEDLVRHTTRTSQVTIVPRVRPADSAPNCGLSPAQVYAGRQTTLLATCDDPEGDPLRVAVTTPPAHGTATPLATTIATFGTQRIRVNYTSAPGYLGYDRVGLRLADAAGGSAGALSLPISVEPTPPVLPAPPAPPPLSPIGQARAALGSPHVVRVGEAGPARIYAIRGDVRRLAVASRAAGTVDVRSWIELRRGGRRTLDRRRAGIVTWGASVVALSRRSIRRIKHAPARARVAFRITVRTGSGAPRRTTVRLKLRR